MKLRRRYLIVLVVFIFSATMIILNVKYDALNRVPGITNETRNLIVNYLDKEEQKYLVEQAIPVDTFIRYIELEPFSIHNVEAYNEVLKTNYYATDYEVVLYTNEVVTLLKADKKVNNVITAIKALIINNMFITYQAVGGFDLQDIYIYDRVRKEEAILDHSFIQRGDEIKKMLSEQGYTTKDEIKAQLDILYAKEEAA